MHLAETKTSTSGRGRERCILGIRGRWFQKNVAKACLEFKSAISQLKQTAMDGH